MQRDVVAEFEDQSKDVLRDGKRAVFRNIRDSNARRRAAARSTQSKPVAVTVMNRRSGKSAITCAVIGDLLITRTVAPAARTGISSAVL